MVELYFITIVDLSFNSQCLLQDNSTTLHWDGKYCKLYLHTALRSFHLSMYKLFRACLYRDYGNSVISNSYIMSRFFMHFNPISSLVERISLKSVGFLLEWLSTTQHEERRGKALRASPGAKYYFYRSFCFWFWNW